MLDDADMLFQIFIDMYSGYITRVEDDIVAVRILMELRKSVNLITKTNHCPAKQHL